MSGRRAIVTGSGGAIGSATVRELRSRGWKVAGLDLEGGDGVFACDVTSQESVAEAVPAAIASLGGGLDALVNNAGIGGPASAGEPPDAHVLKMVDVNLLGAWRVTAAAVEALVESRGRSSSWARGWRSSACRSAPPMGSPSAASPLTRTR